MRSKSGLVYNKHIGSLADFMDLGKKVLIIIIY